MMCANEPSIKKLFKTYSSFNVLLLFTILAITPFINFCSVTILCSKIDWPSFLYRKT